MNSKHIGCDINFAWPAAEIAVLGPKGAAQIIYPKEIEEAENPEEMLARKTEEYRQMYANPFMATKRGFIDDVITPRDTRLRLIRSPQFLENGADVHLDRRFSDAHALTDFLIGTDRAPPSAARRARARTTPRETGFRRAC